MTMDSRAKPSIANLNDELRVFHLGGTVVVSAMIDKLPDSTIKEVFDAIANFTDFNKDNDPYGEHDCAFVTVPALVKRVMFKIDYFDQNMEWASEDPADPKKTTRVMTVCYPEER